MYDALDELIGHDRVVRKMESNVIEIAPLAYMRGRTLKDAFVILDEAQNASKGADEDVPDAPWLWVAHGGRG